MNSGVWQGKRLPVIESQDTGSTTILSAGDFLFQRIGCYHPLPFLPVPVQPNDGLPFLMDDIRTPGKSLSVFYLPLLNQRWQIAGKHFTILILLIAPFNDVGQPVPVLAALAIGQVNVSQPLLMESSGDMTALFLEQMFDGLVWLALERRVGWSEMVVLLPDMRRYAAPSSIF